MSQSNKQKKISTVSKAKKAKKKAAKGVVWDEWGKDAAQGFG
jgi:hypothetical protein